METVALAGLGLLGRGIACCLLAHGCRVLAYTPNASEIPLAESAVEQALAEMVMHEAISQAAASQWRTLWSPVATIRELGAASFVIESVVESLEAKQALYGELESVLASETPIATNTSSLPISALQQKLRHPQRLIGMHWAEPAYATRFLEIIRGPVTDEATAAAAERLGRGLGKEPCVIAGDLPGFIANRLGYAVYREALHLLQTGIADAETIDRSFRNSFGLWAAVCGPLRWIDLTGGPALYLAAMENVLPSLCNSTAPAELAQSVVARDARGAHCGQGFYTYAPDEAELWEQRFRKHVWQIKDMQDKEFPLQAGE